MKTASRTIWFLAAALSVVGVKAQAADWGLISISPMEARPSRISETIVRTKPAGPDCEKNAVRAPQRMAGKILKVAKAEAAVANPEPRKPTMKERIAESDRIAAAGGNNRADRLAQAAFYQASRSRRIADFKWNGLSKKMKKARGRYWSGIGVSKGMCAQASREALNEIGIVLSKGHAYTKRPVLKAAGFKQVAYSPYDAKPGTVFICNGGHSTFGHMEIAVRQNGQQLFCSDFCSPNPTCSRKIYSKPSAFELPGA